MAAQASSHPKSVEAPPEGALRALVWATLFLALLTTAGSLWLSLHMKLKACPLCFYQRTFAMGLLSMAALGLLAPRRHLAIVPLATLPLAVGGGGVAAFHVSLELSRTLECPSGLLGIGTAPQQSLAAYALLLLVVAPAAVRAQKHEISAGLSLLAALLGAAFAVGAVASSPPLPGAPKAPYATPLDTCRVPFVPK